VRWAPSGECRRRRPELERERAAERRHARQPDAATELEHARAGDRQVDDDGGEQRRLAWQQREHHVDRIEQAGLTVAEERLSAILIGIPQQAAAAAQTPASMHEIGVELTVEVVCDEAEIVATARRQHAEREGSGSEHQDRDRRSLAVH
jgi:hypothetical protein